VGRLLQYPKSKQKLIQKTVKTGSKAGSGQQSVSQTSSPLLPAHYNHKTCSDNLSINVSIFMCTIKRVSNLVQCTLLLASECVVKTL